MRQHPLFGVLLALFGAVVLSPDALLLRLSEMSGMQTVAWRGLFMGSTMLLIWAASSQSRRADLRMMCRPAGVTIAICQMFNSLLFCLGIYIAPVAVVLLGVAAVPVFAAILALFLLAEPTRPLTWATIAAVMVGIAIAASGKGVEGLAFDTRTVLGALCGLGVALMLAVNFVVIRAEPRLPVPLAIGCGALCMGTFATVWVGPAQMGEGKVIFMVLTGALVLPVSFIALSLSSRYTHAANVSLIMLLETMMSPLWVWLVLGESPSARMFAGGAIVLGALLVYIVLTGRRTSPSKNDNPCR